MSMVDFNRSSVPLMELVTEPDINSAEEARKFCQELQLILKYLKVSDADMEKGQMRCEVNISLSDTDELGTKVEIKNLNSFRVVEKSIEYEIKRQTEILEEGKKIKQETRGWHDTKQITMEQRSKENAFEYRYFPEPDLPPMDISAEKIEQVRGAMPEIPEEKRLRFKGQFHLEDKMIEIFVRDYYLGIYFERVVSELDRWCKDAGVKDNFEAIKTAANYITGDLMALLKEDSSMASYDAEKLESKITAENFAEFTCMIAKGEISSKIAKIILLEMYNTKGDPSDILEKKGLKQINDTGEIDNIVSEVLAKNPKAVEDYKNGKQNSFTFLVGQVMAASRGKANPQTAGELLKNKLNDN